MAHGIFFPLNCNPRSNFPLKCDPQINMSLRPLVQRYVETSIFSLQKAKILFQVSKKAWSSKKPVRYWKVKRIQSHPSSNSYYQYVKWTKKSSKLRTLKISITENILFYRKLNMKEKQIELVAEQLTSETLLFLIQKQFKSRLLSLCITNWLIC